MPLTTRVDELFLLLDRPSRSSRIKAGRCIRDREITCTSSQVGADLLFHRPCAYYLSIGVGLGAILGRVANVTDSMVEASSLGLAQSLTEEEIALGLIYPRIERSKYHVLLIGLMINHLYDNVLVREISAQIARDVIRAAQKAVSYPFILYGSDH